MSAAPGLAHLIGSVPLASTEDVFRRLSAARASWALFTRLRRENVVPPGLHFQVCLPAAMSSACMYASPRAHDDYLRVYERSLLRALHDITAAIPHRELRIQWDICQEVLVFENYFPSRPADYKTRIFALLERLGAAVAGAFGVATECGWGRGEPARLDGLIESHRRAVDYLLAGPAR